MNDQPNGTTPVARPPIETITKIAFGQLGAPQGALSDDNINKATMGHIFGVITGSLTKSRENLATGEVETFTGLRGSFKAIPLSEKKPEYRSGALYLPAGLDDIIATVQQMEKAKVPVMINMAAEVFCVRAKNPSGYSWGLRSMLPEDTSNDPLAALERMVRPPLALAAPTEQGDAAPFPGAPGDPAKVEPEHEKVPAGGKHKG